MNKRKREMAALERNDAGNGKTSKVARAYSPSPATEVDAVVQIVTGSYERVLHGFSATISKLASAEGSSPPVHFADTFLFNAHASAIRCLALSPLPEQENPESQTILLASGGTDEKINVYSLSASPPLETRKMPSIPTLSGNKISENPQNRELGTLLHHTSSVTSLYFPTRSKLLSASEDNTIAISRTKDLSVISTVKAPQPKIQGQPSGDTNPQGATPSGINDFAVHPSMKLMVSVGRGERCMRLWNLVTGKKAGVLNFGRQILTGIKEGKFSHGEGRRIQWSPDGDEFAVAFERGVIIIGQDSRPRCRILPQPLTKIHQICYRSISSQSGVTKATLALSTEDGRILFYSPEDLEQPERDEATPATSIPDVMVCAQLGGKEAEVSGRIKDFEMVPLSKSGEDGTDMVIATAASDGSVKVWGLISEDLLLTEKGSQSIAKVKQVGKCLGTYQTGVRITCLKAFLMQPSRDEGISEFEGFTEEGEDVSSSNSSS